MICLLNPRCIRNRGDLEKPVTKNVKVLTGFRNPVSKQGSVSVLDQNPTAFCIRIRYRYPIIIVKLQTGITNTVHMAWHTKRAAASLLLLLHSEGRLITFRSNDSPSPRQRTRV